MAAPVRILIVEDEPVIAEMLQEWVCELGCEPVGPAATNEAALALLGDGPLTGAILDIGLAGDDSYEIASRLCDAGVPFVFATGHGSESVEPQFRDVELLQKPFDFEAFTEFVSNIRKRAAACGRH